VTENVLQTFLALYEQELERQSEPGGLAWIQDPQQRRDEQPDNVVGDGNGEICR